VTHRRWQQLSSAGVTTQPIDHIAFRALRVERLDDVLRVTISHPQSAVNAVDDLLHAELTSLFSLLRRERSARALILTAAGRAFSAGGDYGWFPSLHSMERLHELRADAKQLIWDLVDIELPVVAAINGPAVGLGATIVLLCDLIIAAESATIADPHVRVGTWPGMGGRQSGPFWWDRLEPRNTFSPATT